MSERNYYVLCDSNCKFPAMTKEQVLAAIAEATGNTPTCVNDAFISKIKEQNGGKACTVWIGTQAQYNALSEIVVDCLYFITDETTLDDIDRAVVAMGKKVDSAVEAMTKANAQTLEDVNKSVAKFEKNINSKIDEDRERLDALDGVKELTVTSFLGKVTAFAGGETHPAADVTPATGTDISCSGSITFRRQGHICTANFDVTFDFTIGHVFLFYKDMLDIPAEFRPTTSALQIGLLHDDNIPRLYKTEKAVYINSDMIKIAVKEKLTADSSQEYTHRLIGTLTYFV